MKTPDEIKKWLEYCHSSKPCIDCKYDQRDFPHCVRSLLADAINGYEKLVSRLAQVERERDALMESAKGCCETCAFVGDCAKHDPDPTSTGAWWYDDCEEWQWRGVCEDNTKDDADA